MKLVLNKRYTTARTQTDGNRDLDSTMQTQGTKFLQGLGLGCNTKHAPEKKTTVL